MGAALHVEEGTIRSLEDLSVAYSMSALRSTWEKQAYHQGMLDDLSRQASEEEEHELLDNPHYREEDQHRYCCHLILSHQYHHRMGSGCQSLSLQYCRQMDFDCQIRRLHSEKHYLQIQLVCHLSRMGSVTHLQGPTQGIHCRLRKRQKVWMFVESS